MIDKRLVVQHLESDLKMIEKQVEILDAVEEEVVEEVTEEVAEGVAAVVAEVAEEADPRRILKAHYSEMIEKTAFFINPFIIKSSNTPSVILLRILPPFLNLI